MKRSLLTLATLVLVFAPTAAAQAAGEAFPANNENACSTVGGTFDVTGTGQNKVNTCTVGSSTKTTMDVGQEGGKAFYVETSATVYTKDASVTATVGGEKTCYNPGGAEVPSDIPPCQ